MMHLIRRRLGVADDKGAGAVEYLGAILLVSAVVASLLMSATPIGQSIAAKICEAVGATCGATAGTGDDASGPKPQPTDPCTVSSSSQTAAVGIEIAFVDLGAGGTLVVEQLSDGTWNVTRINAGKAGVKADLVAAKGKVTIGGKEFGVGGEVGVSAALAGEGGETYSFKNEQSRDEFVSWAEREWGRQALKSQGFLGWGAALVGGWFDKYSPPAPTKTYFQGGLEASGSAEASAGIGIAEASLGLTLDSGQYLGASFDDKGSTTVYSKVDVGAALEGKIGIGFGDMDTKPEDGAAGGGVGGTLKTNLESTLGTEFDKNGNLTNVELSMAAGPGAATLLSKALGGADVTLTDSMTATAKIPVTDANRADILALVAGAGISSATSNGATQTASVLGLIEYAKGQGGDLTSQTTSTGATTGAGLDLKLKVATIGIGLNGKYEGVSTSNTGAQYWDGTSWQDWTACAGG